MESVVVDSGFLIGLFDETDALHIRCRTFLQNYRGRFLTTEAVLAEALALLSTAQQLRCLDWLADAVRAGLLAVDREPLDFRAIEKLARRYADQPMGLRRRFRRAPRHAQRGARDPHRGPARLRCVSAGGQEAFHRRPGVQGSAVIHFTASCSLWKARAVTTRGHHALNPR